MARSTVLPLFALALAVSGSALAKDSIQASVVPLNTPVPLVTVNGNPYSAGTYAVGTIQLWYTVNAYQFPAGTFASFELNMTDVNYSANPAAAYPVDLKIEQIGSQAPAVNAAPSAFTIGGLPWAGTSTVSISIPESVTTNPAMSVDGTDLVANIRLATTPNGAGVDTVTNVQVHIVLVHPTACVRVFNFFTDTELQKAIDNVTVNVTPKGKLAMTPGQLSDDILVVNGCAESVAFDLPVTLAPLFTASSNGNPVKTFLATGSVTQSDFIGTVFGGETPRGTNLCVGNLQAPAATTLLTTVHIGMRDGLTSASLPAGNTFEFSAKLTEPNTACGTGEVLSSAVPNPAGASLNFTLK